MKKVLMFLAAIGVLAFSAQIASAQEPAAEPASTEEVAAAPAKEMTLAELTAAQEEIPLHQALKTKFIEGGPSFMAAIILCLIIGLAIAIERILYLAFSKTNTKKLLQGIEDALKDGGVEAAKDYCRNTRGPVASIFYQGFLRMDQGI